MRLVLGSCKINSSLHLPSRILKVFIEALNGLSHIYYPDALNNTLLSQGSVLENSSHSGNGWQIIESKDRKAVEELPTAKVQLEG